MSVQFSELHTVRGRVSWSPDGKLLATTERNQVMIRSGDSLQIVAVHTNSDLIDKIEWSPDSRFVLCCQRKRGIVQIWCADDPKWEATIDEGMAGLSNALWSPCSQHIVTVSEFQIRLTIWSLSKGSAKYIKFPKFSDRGVRFSNNGKWMAVAERVNHTDVVGIYSVRYWQLIHRFPMETNDLSDLRWSPNDEYIVCWDNSLQYKFVVYTPRGTKITEYQPYENALGIKNVKWSPDGNFLAVGSYDQITRVFNTLNWRTVAEFKCQNRILPNHQFNSTIIYQESYMETDNHSDSDNDAIDDNATVISNRTDQLWNNGAKNPKKLKKAVKAKSQKLDSNKTRYILGELPIEICPNGGKNSDKDRVGVSKLEWSYDSRFLSVVNDNMNHCVWVWDLKYLTLHSILLHLQPIQSMSWNRTRLQLAVSCGNDRLYLWNRHGSVVIRIVASKFALRSMTWRPKSDCICLVDREHFCCCYDLDFESRHSQSK